MRRDALESMLADALGAPPPREETPDGEAFFLPLCEASGGSLAPVCQLTDGRLSAIWFWVQRLPSGRRDATEQRALLFACLGRDDPARGEPRAVVLEYKSARAMIATEPRAGDAVLRISYR